MTTSRTTYTDPASIGAQQRQELRASVRQSATPPPQSFPTAQLGGGSIDNFIAGMRESADASTRTALATVGVYVGIRSWPALKRFMRTH